MNETRNEQSDVVTSKRAWHTPTLTMLDIDATAGGPYFHGPESDFTHPIS